jgi:hypothetical protein
MRMLVTGGIRDPGNADSRSGDGIGSEASQMLGPAA